MAQMFPITAIHRRRANAPQIKTAQPLSRPEFLYTPAGGEWKSEQLLKPIKWIKKAPQT